jgi:hypothetical protein
MSWRVELLPEVSDWLAKLNQRDYEHNLIALKMLEDEGPRLGRPFVDHVKGSIFPNMKELRPLGGNLRLLFAFDPERNAIVLVAGDKSNDWTDWYKRNIRIADQRFSAHLLRMKREV